MLIFPQHVTQKVLVSQHLAQRLKLSDKTNEAPPPSNFALLTPSAV